MKSLNKKKKSSSKQKTNKILAVLTLCTLGITALIVGQFVVLDYDTNKILQQGTVINGRNLSGVTKKEASNILLNDFKSKAEDFNLTITSDNKEWQFDKSDFKVNSDIHTILEASQDRDALLSNKESQVDLLTQFNREGGAVNVAFNYMFVGLDEKIENIIKEVEIEPINSEIEFTPNEKNLFNITDSVNGKRVDKNALYRDINEQFLISDTINVGLQFVEEIPAITKEYNENLTKKISSFSTKVADSTGGRKHNVKKALNEFNGFILEPNQQISFNEIIGEHTIENGYKTATIIFNGEFTDGIGGGICQASSTLYNALLLGGVEINEVHKHSLPVMYVPLGLDAMVSEHTADLKFTNTSEYPIYIHTYSDSQSVSVELYSHPLMNTFKTRSETIKTIEAGDKVIEDTNGEYSSKVLFKGEYFRVSYPKNGYEAKAYLQTFHDGELIEEKEIRHETYLPQKGVVIEGCEELPDGMSPIDSGVKIITTEEWDGKIFLSIFYA